MSNGKGDKPRPRQVSWEKYSHNWENIFKKKKKIPKKEKGETKNVSKQM